MRSSLCILLFVLFLGIALPQESLAYLEPGSGSMILQLLLGGFVGVAAVVKLYWKSFVAKFRHPNSENNRTFPTSKYNE